MLNESSPEEKLLHLIKGKHDRNIPAQPKIDEPELKVISQEEKQSEPSSGKAPGNDKELNVNNGALSNESKAVGKNREATQASRSILKTNYLIFSAFIILVILAGYFIFTALIGNGDKEVENLKLLIESFSEAGEVEQSKQEKAAPDTEVAGNEDITKNEASSASFEDYQKMLSKKAIFLPPAKSNIEQQDIEEPSLRDLIKDLSLVGIIPGDRPQVIIEDKRNGQTLFLQVGEMIDMIKIKEIQSGRVVLEIGDETITLSL